MKLWIDDVRPAPEGYYWCTSVNEAKMIIEYCEKEYAYAVKKAENTEFELYKACFINLADEWNIGIIDIDHDAGEYARLGGDYIKLLDWLEETGRNYPIRIHSMNPVGRENMRAIIQRNGWTEVM